MTLSEINIREHGWRMVCVAQTSRCEPRGRRSLTSLRLAVFEPVRGVLPFALQSHPEPLVQLLLVAAVRRQG